MYNVKLLVNRVRPDMIQRNDMMSVKDVQEMLGIPLLGAIPEDEQVRGTGGEGGVRGREGKGEIEPLCVCVCSWGSFEWLKQRHKRHPFLDAPSSFTP